MRPPADDGEGWLPGNARSYPAPQACLTLLWLCEHTGGQERVQAAEESCNDIPKRRGHRLDARPQLCFAFRVTRSQVLVTRLKQN